MIRRQKSVGGFTIIEVVLVLAIAGLIFLMVFVALPTLQRSQRDTQRKKDVDKVVAAVTNWQADGNRNTGTPRCTLSASPTYFTPNSVACKFLGNYLNDEIWVQDISFDDFKNKSTFKDPSGNSYSIVFRNNAYGDTGVDYLDERTTWGLDFSTFGAYTIVVTFGAKCAPGKTYNGKDTGGLERVTTNGTSTAYNFFAVRYRLEDGTIYCRDNSD